LRPGAEQSGTVPEGENLVFARRIEAQLLHGQRTRPCPLPWLDSFFMRSFTGHSAFDDSLPLADGLIEAGFAIDLQALKADLEEWLTRKFGEGRHVNLILREVDSKPLPRAKVKQ
jgi:hypothetical protein